MDKETIDLLWEIGRYSLMVLGGLAWVIPLWLVFRRDKKLMREYEQTL